jgi:hypothetical protein
MNKEIYNAGRPQLLLDSMIRESNYDRSEKPDSSLPAHHI